MKTIIIGLMSLVSITALAGERGNGGSAAVCFDSPVIAKKVADSNYRVDSASLNHITSITALDLLQARANVNNDDSALILKGDQEKTKDYVKRIAKRFNNDQLQLPMLESFLLGYFNALDTNTSHYSFGGIPSMNDTSESYYLDDKCLVLPLIRQSYDTGKAGLEIDDRLFKHEKHSEQSRGVLLVHEVALNWARQINTAYKVNPLDYSIGNALGDVSGVRQITAKLITKNITVSDFLTVLTPTKLTLRPKLHYNQGVCDVVFPFPQSRGDIDSGHVVFTVPNTPEGCAGKPDMLVFGSDHAIYLEGVLESADHKTIPTF